MLEVVTLFEGLDSGSIKTIETLVTVRSMSKRTVILTQGEESSSLYLVLEGRLKAYLSDAEGREVTLGHIEQGEAFGELSLLDGKPRSASVMALTNTRCAVLSRGNFLSILSANPGIALHLLEIMASRVRTSTASIADFALLDVYGRIARVLMDSSREDESGRRITEPLTHQELASRVGSSREMVTRILNDLRRGGYIAIDHKCIILNRNLPARW
ncbi:Crp/Fnr family transcriptional regulator [Candidatus Woesearchaeota archaeon]|nr:Crp/Fnr family transcriptional regulator [Candidatus Woesearchaeota archaeon]